MSKEAKLTDKQKLFINAYVATLNATESARLAKYKGEDNTLAAVGKENLRKPQIRDEINQRLREITIDEDEVVQRLSRIATGSIEDFIGEDGSFSLEKARSRGAIHLIKKYKIREGPKSKATGRSLWQETEVELYPADSALEKLARLYGLDKRIVEVHWRKEAEEVGIDASAIFEQLVNEYATSIRSGSPSADS